MTRNMLIIFALSLVFVSLFTYVSKISRVPNVVNVVQMCGAGLNHTDQTNLYWVITSGNLHIINQVALESIFLHNPTASLVLLLREGMVKRDVEAITFVVQRFIKDGYQVSIRHYNFRSLLSTVSSEEKGLLNPPLAQTVATSPRSLQPGKDLEDLFLQK